MILTQNDGEKFVGIMVWVEECPDKTHWHTHGDGHYHAEFTPEFEKTLHTK